MDDERLDELVQRADLDGLVRLIDGLTASADWTGLRSTRDRCRAAVSTGRQLWPAATLAEYRLALLAPPEHAAGVLDDDGTALTIGPLTEVIAQHHRWAELAPLLGTAPASASIVAHERLLRGEIPSPSSVAGLPAVLEMPYRLAPWEPTYLLATYGDDGIDAPAPAPPPSAAERRRRRTRDAERLDDDDVELAVRQLVEAWTASSNGRAEVACVDGDADDAVAALGLSTWVRRPVTLADALARLAWAGASGGAHGRRRGAALGRFGALWVLAALLDDVDDWPVELDTLGAEAAALRWFAWESGEPELGWRLQVAVEDVQEGVAWSINAVDAA